MSAAAAGKEAEPFGSHTEFDYLIPVSGRVELAVYNVLGRRMCTLHDRPGSEGDPRETRATIAVAM
jgi:hypothetical protein